MIVIGNEELIKPIGKQVTCKNCGELHDIEYGDEVLADGSKKRCNLLAFYSCGDTVYLAGISGLEI